MFINATISGMMMLSTIVRKSVGYRAFLLLRLDNWLSLCYNKATKGNLPVHGIALKLWLQKVTAVRGRSGYFLLCPTATSNAANEMSTMVY